MSRILLPKMVAKGGGVIVNISSLGYLFAMPQFSVYSATKVKGVGHKGLSIGKLLCESVKSCRLTLNSGVLKFQCRYLSITYLMV